MWNLSYLTHCYYQVTMTIVNCLFTLLLIISMSRNKRKKSKKKSDKGIETELTAQQPDLNDHPFTIVPGENGVLCEIHEGQGM